MYKDNPFLKWLPDEKRLKIYRASPLEVETRQLILDNGEILPADAIVFATGWKPSTDYFGGEDAKELGVPLDNEDNKQSRMDMQQSTKWEVRRLLPLLRQAPEYADTYGQRKRYTPFRLYRQVLSPALINKGDRSIAFAGFLSSGQTAFGTEIIALWAAAWLEDLLPRSSLPSQVLMEEWVAQLNAWLGLRYANRGARDPDIIVEVQSFFDTLMIDLGLDLRRKERRGQGRLREWLQPYRSRDYKTIVDEFLELQRYPVPVDMNGHAKGE